jgi:transcriptional regulator NrdR family protein
MECPFCREGRLVVKDTKKDDRFVRVVRRRVCTENPAHVIDTVEQPELISFDQVRVRAQDGTVIPFSQRRLGADVQAAVLKRLERGEVTAIVDSVVAGLREQLARRLREPAPGASDGTYFVVDDEQIVQEVELALRQGPDRVGHILYALSVRGRLGSKRGPGFQDATDFLRWMFQDDSYPDQRVELPAPAGRSVERWWPPAVDTPLPTTVIKKDGKPRGFSRGRFETSVSNALFGRANVEVTSRGVVDWVLWRLAGQERVLSAQLAVHVMACLRRVDDIGYLRYAGVGKGFDNVRQYRDEALGLLTHPSPMLDLSPERARSLEPPDLIGRPYEA